MKYIRTKNGRIAEIKENMVVKVCDDATRLVYKEKPHICVLNGDDDILKQGDTIEELCDGICAIERNGKLKVPYVGKTTQDLKIIIDLIDKDNYEVYGAVWTSKGLKYVAKMNEKGELELL